MVFCVLLFAFLGHHGWRKRCSIAFSFYFSFSWTSAPFLHCPRTSPQLPLSASLTRSHCAHVLTVPSTRLRVAVCIFSISTCFRPFFIGIERLYFQFFDIQHFKFSISVLLPLVDKGSVYETIAQFRFCKFCLSKVIQWLECPCFESY